MNQHVDLTMYRDLVARIRINHPAFELATAELSRSFKSVGKTDFPLCLQIIGPSRAGKTCVIKDFIKTVPAVRHEDGMRIPVVYARVPPKGTTTALMENILRALGDPYWYRGSESNKLARVIMQLEQCECRMLVLDEFQHLCDKGQNKTLKQTTDNLKALVEPNKWALVASGLSESRRVVDFDSQLEGRFDAEVEIPRFDWMSHDSNEKFRGVISAFQGALHPFDFPSFDSEEMALRLYLATGGLMGLLVKLLHRAIDDGIRDGRTAVDLGQLEQAYRRAIRQSSRVEVGQGPFECEVDATNAKSRIEEMVNMAAALPDEEESAPATGTDTSKNRKKRRQTKSDHKQALAEAL